MRATAKGIRMLTGVVATALLCGASAFAPSAFAQTAQVAAHTIRATGEATVEVAPDQAEMTVAVLTQATTAEQAAADNAARTTAVVAALKAALDAKATVKTSGYNLSPNYTYPPQGGEPKLNGYNATNSVRVVTRDLARVGPAIDAAVKAGANNVQGIQFGLSDESAAQAEALSRAAMNAKNRAVAMGSGLGVTPTEILAVEDGSAVVRPVVYEAMAMRASDARTPVEPGTVEVRATVTVTMRF